MIRTQLSALKSQFWVLIAVLAIGPSFAFAGSSVRRNVEIEWEAIEGATQYEIQVIRQDSVAKKPLHFKTLMPHWTATINPGLYRMQIRSFDQRGAPGDWSPASDLQVKLPSVIQSSPKMGEVVKASEEKSEEIKLHWEEVPGAAKYAVSIRNLDGTWRQDKEVAETSIRTSVPVGDDFEWNVHAIDPKGEPGELNAVATRFQILGPKLQKPTVQKPISKYVSEVKWEAPAYAKKFSYELSYRNPKTNKWQKLEAKSNQTEAKLKLDISRPSGKYRIKVQAHGDKRLPSSVAQLDFETRGGFRDPAALEAAIMRDSITKPTNYYMITSYLLTQIQYKGVDYDSHNSSTFNAIGGTGRVGLGYQNPDSNWGGFGIVDLSGFTIHGQNFQFASIEGHVTHKLEFGQHGLFQAAAGVFSKELPIVKGSTFEGFTGVGKARNIGPHAGFTYWFPLTQRLGAQLNARGYYSLLGSTTTGAKAEASLSYQYGLLGTYRLSSEWMGYAGYAYRKDEARYDVKTDPSSFAQPGQINSIDIDGHYINLLLEFSF